MQQNRISDCRWGPILIPTPGLPREEQQTVWSQGLLRGVWWLACGLVVIVMVTKICPARDVAPPGWFREAVLFLVCPGFAGQDSVSDEMQVH